jgi:phenylalanyl-tRNA synthetase beta chain
MKILTNWLREFVAIPAEVDDRRLARDLTAVGLAVDAVETAANGEPLLDMDITTNRPDAMNHYGIAREASVIYDCDLTPVRPQVAESSRPASEAAAIEIADPDLCPRYCARVILGVKIGPSPEWMVRRLEAAGLRSINNVADVTNYLMMELGHPLHAFDLDTLRGRRIVVRRARPGETFMTLDGVTRTFTPDHLMIADGERAVAIAGVMGGEETGVHPHTVNVLLESAWFEPTSIRPTARHHGMHTDASHRFERGADLELAPVAADAAAALIQQVAGGEVLRGLLDCYPAPKQRTAIALRRGELDRILGIPVPAAAVLRILRRLGFRAEELGYGAWKLVPPSFRLDVGREIDVIEEVARHYGLDKFPARLPASVGNARRATHWAAERALRDAARGLGYHQTISLTVTSVARAARFSATPPVELANPLSAEYAAMRTSLVGSMADAVEWNVNRGVSGVRLFEIGRIYHAANGEYREPNVLGLTSTSGGFSLFKGDVETILDLFAHPRLEFLPGAGAACFHPGRSARALMEGATVARFGELHPEIGFRLPVMVAEIFLDPLFACGLRRAAYQEVSRFPAVERDLALVLPEGVTYGQVEAVVRSLGPADLQELAAVEVFRGGQIAPGKYGLLLRLRFQSVERTLADDEVNARASQVVAALEKQVSATLRA